MTWYPEKLMVGGKGTLSTTKFIKQNFSEDKAFTYMELGIYEGMTAQSIAENFPNAQILLFDYAENISRAQSNLQEYEKRIQYFSNSQKYLDSYCWTLAKHCENKKPFIDYCFIDGPHTFAIDALAFFIVDKYLKVGGYIDFDDYSWTLKNSSLDPNKVPETSLIYTDEQIESQQVKMIVDMFIKTDNRYKEIIKDKIYQKIFKLCKIYTQL